MLLCHEDLNNEQSVRKQLEDWNVDNIAIRAKSTATDQSVLKLVVLVRLGEGGLMERRRKILDRPVY